MPKRGERIATPRTLAKVKLSAITAALVEAHAPGPDGTSRLEGVIAGLMELEHQLAERGRYS